MHEFSFIENLLTPLSNKKHALDLKDDVATLPQKKLVLSTDTIIEEIHFQKNTSPENIAHKLLAVSLSDITSKGATPELYTLNLSLNNTDKIWLTNFSNSLKKLQKQYNITLLGGDTTKTLGNLTFSCTIFGSYKKTFIKRSSAQPNQDIWVTGTIGDAYPKISKNFSSKKNTISKTDKNFLEEAYLKPNPKLTHINLIQKFATSSIDISDGLIQDLNHILTNSQIGANIDLAKIPLSTALKNYLKIFPKDLKKIYNAGDDYQILFTAKMQHRQKIENFAKNKNLQITKIGSTTKNKTLTTTPKTILPQGHNHF